MGEIFKLFGTIGVDNKEAKQSLSETEKAGQTTTNKLTNFFNNMSNKVSKSLSGIGKKIDFKGMSTQFNQLGGKINGALVKGVKAGAKFLAVGGAATMAAAGATLVKSMNFAGELEQNMGGSEAVFGKFAKKMQDTGIEAYSKMGLSQSDFLASANKMGSLYQGVGFTVQESANMSAETMQRAADVASIMGIDIGSAMEAVNGMAKGNFEMMDNLGVAMNDTAIGNYALSKGIEKSTAKMTTQEKVGLANQMFLEKTAKYAGNYAKENDTLSGSLQTAKSALSNFVAGAGDIDAVIESGMNFAGIAAKSAGELAPKLFAGISKAVATLIPKIPGIVSDLASGMADVIGEMFGESAKTKFESLVGVISDALQGLQTAFEFIVKYKDIFTPIAVGIGTIVGFLSAWNAITKAATALQTAFNVVLNANPLGIVVLAIIGVVTALTYFFTQTETGKKVLEVFVNFIKTAWQSIKDKTTEIFTAVADFLSNTWNTIVETVTSLVQGMADFLSGIWETIKNVAQTVWNVIFAVVGGIITSYIAIWQGIFEGLKIYLGIIWDGIKAVASTVWNAIGGTVMNIVNGFVNLVLTIFNGWKNAITVVFNAIWSVAITVWNSIKDVVMTVVNAIVSIVSNIFNTLKNTLTNIFNAIRNVASTVWNAVKNSIVTVVNSIKNIVSSVFNALKNVITTIFNGIRNTVSTVWNSIRSTISNVVNGIKSTVSNTFETLKGTVSRIWNGIKSAIETPMNKAKEIVKSIVDTIRGFFNFSFSWPHIPVPQFSISPSGWKVGDLLKGKIPSLGISWHAKGGIFDEPTLLGGGSQLHGVGEAGAEAVAPIDTLLDYVRQAVIEVMGINRDDGDIIVYQTINSPKELTPRETARQTKLALQDLAALRKK